MFIAEAVAVTKRDGVLIWHKSSHGIVVKLQLGVD